MMLDRFRELVERLSFGEAKSVVSEMPFRELHDLVVKYGFQGADLRLYTFLAWCAAEEEDSSWHYLASVVLSQPLCHIGGAYYSAFYHAECALSLAPQDASLMEYLLFFNCIPDKPLKNTEAVRVAKALLDLDPDNSAAKECLSKRTK